MKELKPLLAARLAEDVYTLTKEKSIELALEKLNFRFGDIFTFGTDQLLKGRTGGPGIIKSRTAFGFTVVGKKGSPLAGQAIILFRGTQYLGDWLTNFNMGASRSSYSQPVHDGFNRAFKSMQFEIEQFVNCLGPEIRAVHCIGHSLGGALATLCAEWLQCSTKYNPYLYSFGSPRVGLQSFAQMCTSEIGSAKIFRAYHKTDIVPCIPFWPFVHTPNSGDDYYLPSPGTIPLAKYHGMDEYVASVKTSGDWLKLANKRPVKDNASIERWLKKGGVVGFTMASIEWLNDALFYVLNQCFKAVKGILGVAITSTFTLMDQIAYVLHKGIDLAQSLSKWIMRLMRKIMSFLGMQKVVDTSDMTAQFIRDIFSKLSYKMNSYCQQTLDKVLVDGRGI